MRSPLLLHVVQPAWLLAISLPLCSVVTARGALDIQFDYRFDSNNFFVGHPERQAVLEAAAEAFELRLADTLTAIVPGGGNMWTAITDHPGTGAEVRLDNLTIPTGVVLVFAGARQLGASTLGVGGPGGFEVSGTQEFVNTVVARGQAGALMNPPTDFGPFGGAITFDIDTAWYFDPDVRTTEAFGAQSDFYSVGLHELGHLLGFGTAPSFDTFVTGTVFTGPASMAQNNGLPVPLSADFGHWAEGTTSRVMTPVTLALQETAMDPTLLTGTRKYFTELDYAGLDDVGWLVVPEPGSAISMVAGALILLGRRRRV